MNGGHRQTGNSSQQGKGFVDRFEQHIQHDGQNDLGQQDDQFTANTADMEEGLVSRPNSGQLRRRPRQR